MLLAVDIGNTNIVMGIFEKEKLLVHWRLGTDIGRTVDEYALTLLGLTEKTPLTQNKKITGVIIASVVPGLTAVWEELSLQYIKHKALVVDADTVPMPIVYDNPLEVGTDRIVNAYAAWRLYRKENNPLIIVDFGTATTFDVVSVQGEYLGGAIAPGIGISSEALFQKTAKLPRVALKKPARCLGKNTVESMQAGLVYGYVGLVKEIIRQLTAEISGDPIIIGTGGLVPFIQGAEKLFEIVDPHITLIGLRFIFERVKENDKKSQ